jgi:glycosyltransferase involved in cell wall biosynthesis
MRILAVTNIYPTQEQPGNGVFVEQQIKGLRLIGLDVDVMFVDRLRRGMHAYLGLGRKLRAMAEEFHPDIVHVMYGGVMADIVIWSIQDRPIVVSFCGSDLFGEPCSGISRKLIAGYGVLASHRVAKRADGIVVKSKILENALPTDVNRAKVRVIPNGIDLELFRPLNRRACRRLLGWTDNGFHVLFPANAVNPIKRFDLARASVEVAKRNGMPVELHELRGVSHNDVPVWLNASDVALLTSSHEGSPNVVKEALACDLPVVSVDVGDVRDRVHDIDGCYIAAPEPRDLANKLSLVYSSTRRVAGRIKMGELSLHHIALELKKLYEIVVRLSCSGICPDDVFAPQ